MEEWKDEELLELLEVVLDHVDPSDGRTYSRSFESIQWDEVYLEGRTVEECREKVKEVMKNVRKHRTMQEILADAKEGIANGSLLKKKNKQNDSARKHPDFPKKPLSSYMLYYMDRKVKILQENPGASMIEVTKIIADKFKALSAKKREKYDRLAEQLRAEYQEKLKEFYEMHPEEKRGTKRSHLPPPPKTPFQIYQAEKLEKNADPGMTHAEFHDLSRRMYDGLKTKRKVKYIMKAREGLVQYVKELSVHNALFPEDAIPSIKNILNSEERKMLEEWKGKPATPPNSGYSYFSRMMLDNEEVKKLPNKQRMQEISKFWKELSDEERAIYTNRALQLREEYKLLYASYLESKEETLDDLLIPPPSKKSKTTAASKESHFLKTPEYFYAFAKGAQFKEEFPTLSPHELRMLVLEHFASLSNKKKLKYEALAREQVKETGRRKERNQGALNHEDGHQPPNSARGLFMEEYKKSHPEASRETLLKQWKDLQAKDKKAYKEKWESLRSQLSAVFSHFLDHNEDAGEEQE
ncbi:unnamed protein product [Darwinula stevensoni]|uniref:HMG box domain-containing protein n=1 Tax=Darwinula stevensoni TaxID=69355 RepID=A0A7R9A8Q6_9CRUS|nr:unnamed protein product [Darwinula stevensoni]CAG0896551.1 unnamed protein product [Darwinula stevensoni]